MNFKKTTLLLLTLFIVLTTVSAISAASDNSSSIADDSQSAPVDTVTTSDSSSSDTSSSSSSSDVATSTPTKVVETQKTTTSSSSSEKVSTDTTSSTKVSTDTTTSSEKVSTDTTSSSQSNTKTSDSQDVSSVNDNSDKNIVKTSTVDSKENTKTAMTHIVNSENVGEFFDISDSTNGELTDIVQEGDTLDIQGTINLTNTSLTINKPVNIISSTNDGTIILNTVAGSYFGDNPGSSFIINTEGSYTNVTGVNFYNSQLWICNTSHVTFDNISAVVEDLRVGSGIGQTSIREGSEYITIKNSLISTTENEGSSSLVLARANYCTIDNCTIQGVGFVGNLIYLNTYNVEIPAGERYNSHNNITNNVLIGPETVTNTCYALYVNGYDNYVVNNTIIYDGQNFAAGGSDNIYINNTGDEKGAATIPANSTFINNTFGATNIQANSYLEGNTIYNITALNGNATLVNNTIIQNITATSSSLAYANASLINNTIGGNINLQNNYTLTGNTISGNVTLNSSSKATNLVNNTIGGTIVILGSGNNIEDNIVNTNNKYAINVTGSNNTIVNDYLLANTAAGIDAIINTTSDNIIENITPELNTIIISEENYGDYFDELGQLINPIENYTTILINGTLNNKKFIIDDEILTIKGLDENALLINTSITSGDSSRLSIQDLTINNTESGIETIIDFESDYNEIDYCNIYSYSESDFTNTIVLKGSNNRITNSNITVYAPSGDVNYSINPQIAPTVAIAIFSSNNLIQYNNIEVITTTDKSPDKYGTVEAITIQAYDQNSTMEYNTITNNNITTQGIDYAYGVNIANSSYNNVSNNNINVTSTSYANGIQIGSDPSNNNVFASNTINVTATDSAYGIIISGYNGNTLNNNNMTSNTIYVNASQAYGIEIYVSYGSAEIKNTTVRSNTLNIVGDYAMGIGLYDVSNITINSNTFNINGTSNGTTFSFDMIKPTTAGIVLENCGDSVIITSNSRINVTNGFGIKVNNTNNANISSNTIYTTNSVGVYLNASNSTYMYSNTMAGQVTGVVIEDSVNNNLTINKINSTAVDYTIEIVGDSSDNIVQNNTLIASELTGNFAVKTENDDNTVVFNGPATIYLTDDNYSTYFDEDGVLRTGYESINTTIFLASDLYNKDMTFKTNVTLDNNGSYTIYDSTITFSDQATTSYSYLNNINMNSTDGRESLIIIDSLYVTIQNCTIYQNNENTGARTIFVTENGSIRNMYNNNITVYGAEIKTDDGTPSLAIIYENATGVPNANIGTSTTQPAGNFYIEATTGDGEGSTAGIYAISRANTTNVDYLNLTVIGINNATGISTNVTYLYYSNINVSSGNIATGFKITNQTVTYSTTMAYSNMTVTAPNQAIGIDVSNSYSFYAQHNRINVISNGTAIGINLEDSNKSSTTTRLLNQTITITGADAIAVNLDNSPLDVMNSTLTVTGTTAQAIVDANAEYASGYINITNNNVTINTENPTVAIELENMTGVSVKNNTIETNSESQYIITVTDSNNINVTNNSLSNNGFKLGDSAVGVTNSENIIVQDNPSDELILTVTTVETTKVGDTIILTAELNDKAINNGYVIFKVNGKTLKDADGIVIEVPVIDGVATYNYTIPATSSTTYTVSAVYNGEYGVVRSDNTTFTATPSSANIELTTTGTLMPGQTVTFTAYITDEFGNAVTTGKVVFKLNGVSLKDAEGNVMYAYVDENGIASINYTIPSNFSAKDYILTAVFQGTGYERTETNDTITITKINTKVTVDSSIVDATTNTITITQGENLQLKATITDEAGNAVSGTTKVAVKINEKTVIQQYVTDGVIDLTIYTSSFKNPTYSIEIIAGENSQYNKSTYNGTLSVLEPNSLLIKETSNNGTLTVLEPDSLINETSNNGTLLVVKD